MLKTNYAQIAYCSGLLNTRVAENDADGLEIRGESGATDELGGESRSEDVLEGVVAIVDSLDEWQKPGGRSGPQSWSFSAMGKSTLIL
ncbi:hypothetical protein C6366_01585 [Desulfonatronum sp. SC1]|nr:hypothetical protein C6366_01585 [Desulfonatronum sp. SC1]